MAESRDICFVIMPFGRELQPVWDAIRDAVRPHGEDLECVRLDELMHAGRITDDLTSYIRKSSICIADLTGLNPNVMWETGFAMSLGKPLIFISQDADNLPFDLKGFRVIEYALDDPRENLSSKLLLALNATARQYRWSKDQEPLEEPTEESIEDVSADGQVPHRSRGDSRRGLIYAAIAIMAVLIGGVALYQLRIDSLQTEVADLHGNLERLEADKAALEAECKEAQPCAKGLGSRLDAVLGERNWFVYPDGSRDQIGVQRYPAHSTVTEPIRTVDSPDGRFNLGEVVPKAVGANAILDYCWQKSDIPAWQLSALHAWRNARYNDTVGLTRARISELFGNDRWRWNTERPFSAVGTLDRSLDIIYPITSVDADDDSKYGVGSRPVPPGHKVTIWVAGEIADEE